MYLWWWGWWTFSWLTGVSSSSSFLPSQAISNSRSCACIVMREFYFNGCGRKCQKKPPFSHQPIRPQPWSYVSYPSCGLCLHFRTQGVFLRHFLRALLLLFLYWLLFLFFSKNQNIPFAAFFLSPPGIQAIFHCCGCCLYCMFCEYCKGVFETWAFS